MAAKHLACAPEAGDSESEKLLVQNSDQPVPAPLGYDRLPLNWYKNATRRLKERVAGMTFSVEPGLFDPQSGIGVDPSDKLLVLRDKAVLLSCVPYSREWSFLQL